jgi:Tfp pilus assembly protein PilN
MINLLPTEEKRQLRAARSNTLLIRYNFFLIGTVAFMGLAVAVTYLYLNTTEASAQRTIQTNASRVTQYASIEAQAQQFKLHLATAKQILDNEVTYSNVILEIAQLIPSGVILQNLSLDSQTFGSATTLIAEAKDYTSALALKESFSKSPLFSDVHFQSITSGNAQGDYPITVNLDVTIQKGAAK